MFHESFSLNKLTKPGGGAEHSLISGPQVRCQDGKPVKQQRAVRARLPLCTLRMGRGQVLREGGQGTGRLTLFSFA